MTDNQKTVITKMRMSGESYNAIARALNISPSTVKSFCIRNDIGIGEHSDGKHCVECGVELTGRQSRFCSESCRHKNWLSTHHDYEDAAKQKRNDLFKKPNARYSELCEAYDDDGMQIFKELDV